MLRPRVIVEIEDKYYGGLDHTSTAATTNMDMIKHISCVMFILRSIMVAGINPCKKRKRLMVLELKQITATGQKTNIAPV